MGGRTGAEGALMMSMKTKSSLDSLGPWIKKQLHIFGPNKKLADSEPKQNKAKQKPVVENCLILVACKSFHFSQFLKELELKYNSTNIMTRLEFYIK